MERQDHGRQGRPAVVVVLFLVLVGGPLRKITPLVGYHCVNNETATDRMEFFKTTWLLFRVMSGCRVVVLDFSVSLGVVVEEEVTARRWTVQDDATRRLIVAVVEVVVVQQQGETWNTVASSIILVGCVRVRVFRRHGLDFRPRSVGRTNPVNKNCLFRRKAKKFSGRGSIFFHRTNTMLSLPPDEPAGRLEDCLGRLCVAVIRRFGLRPSKRIRLHRKATTPL